MLRLLKTDATRRTIDGPRAERNDTGKAVVSTLRPSSAAPRDWSNVVFSVAFCEEAKRDYEARLAG